MYHSVVYRTGGTHWCKWHRVLDNYATFQQANDKANEIKRMGYKAIVHKTDTLNTIGLPVGWKHDSVDWEKDEINVTPYLTEHKKR